jgi:hypothetical protein
MRSIFEVKLKLVRERIEHLQIGPGRIDAERAQGGVVPGQFEHRRQPLEVASGGRVKDDLARILRAVKALKASWLCGATMTRTTLWPSRRNFWWRLK